MDDDRYLEMILGKLWHEGFSAATSGMLLFFGVNRSASIHRAKKEIDDYVRGKIDAETARILDQRTIPPGAILNFSSGSDSRNTNTEDPIRIRSKTDGI